MQPSTRAYFSAVSRMLAARSKVSSSVSLQWSEDWCATSFSCNMQKTRQRAETREITKNHFKSCPGFLLFAFFFSLSTRYDCSQKPVPPYPRTCSALLPRVLGFVRAGESSSRLSCSDTRGLSGNLALGGF